jgi:hypothetical protein
MQHLAVTDEIAAGLRALPETTGSFAAAQAAWRFYQNEKITLPKLMTPIIEQAREAVANNCDQFVLVAHDWSGINYSRHDSKTDRIRLNIDQWGYDLQVALLVSDHNGTPLAPAYLGVKGNDGVHSTRSAQPLAKRTQLDEVGLTMQHVQGLKLNKQLVHIIDAEANSVLHLRRFDSKKFAFIVRSNLSRRVLFEGRDVLLTEVLTKIGNSYRYCGQVDYKGHKVDQYVTETTVTLHREAKLQRQKNGQPYRRYVKGKALTLRLVLSQVRDEEGKELSTWLLWTNLAEIKAETIAQWYYWRWRIESYFKLLKSAGHHIEQWQQENAAAMARRLLIAAQACLIVWHLARSQAKEAEPARRLLVRLSGRLIKRTKTFTEPALLAGMWVLLAMLDALEHYTVEELRQMAHFILPWRNKMESG